MSLNTTHSTRNPRPLLFNTIWLAKQASYFAAPPRYHISVVAVHGVQYLLTLNCKHIANPSLHARIESVCRDMGCEPPVNCTPQELVEINDVYCSRGR